MIISFYLDNENHQGVDYSNPELGNPGIGGTQYMFWALAYYLKKFHKDVDVNIIAPYIETMPSSINSYKADSIVDSIKIAKELGTDILVLRGPTRNQKLFSMIEIYKINVVFWSHNFENWEFVDLASKSSYVKRNICVGKEQLDRLRDHEIFLKSSYIYNALDFNIYKCCDSIKKDKIVGYMGSLTKRKGFHKLAKVWKEIVKEVPDAKLYVLGGGNLYGKKWRMGEWNITNPAYEKVIMRYLTDKSGNILDSVEFKGVVSGEEKLNLLNDIRVGVANPTGVGETFCIVAAEYEAMGVPVVTIRKNGFLDTVSDNKSGLLFRNEREFIKSIVRLLNNDKLVKEFGMYGKEMVRRKFDIEKISNEWYILFTKIINDEEINIEWEASNWSNDLKWLREINRRLKKNKLFRWIPSILWYKDKVYNCYSYLKSKKIILHYLSVFKLF